MQNFVDHTPLQRCNIAELFQTPARCRQGWEPIVPAWTFANIICAEKSRYCAGYAPSVGGCVNAISDWCNAPNGPPLGNFLLSQIAKYKCFLRERLVEKMQKAAGWLHMTGDVELDAAHRKAVEAVGEQYDYAIKWFADKRDATTTMLPRAMQYAAVNGGPFICGSLKSIAKRQLVALETLKKCASQVGASFIVADQPHINKASLEFFIANQRYQNQKVSDASKAAQAKMKRQLKEQGYYINSAGCRVVALGNPKISKTATVEASAARKRNSDLRYQQIKPSLQILVDRGLSLRAMGYELGISPTCARKYKGKLLNGD